MKHFDFETSLNMTVFRMCWIDHVISGQNAEGISSYSHLNNFSFHFDFIHITSLCLFMSLCLSLGSWLASLCASRMKSELDETLGSRPCCFICISPCSLPARKSPSGGESPLLQLFPQCVYLCVPLWCLCLLGAGEAPASEYPQAPTPPPPSFALPRVPFFFPFPAFVQMYLFGLKRDYGETLALNTLRPPPQLTPLSWVEMKVDRIIMLMSTPLTGQLYQYQLYRGTFTLC